MNLEYTHEIHDECGVFGVFGHPDASRLTYLGLYALQHRGQESAGICASDYSQHRFHVGMGLVADIFTPDNMENLKGEEVSIINRFYLYPMFI